MSLSSASSLLSLSSSSCSSSSSSSSSSSTGYMTKVKQLNRESKWTVAVFTSDDVLPMGIISLFFVAMLFSFIKEYSLESSQKL